MVANFADTRSTATETGRRYSPVYPMIVKLVVLSNAVSFFGKDLGKRSLLKLPVFFLIYVVERSWSQSLPLTSTNFTSQK